jgi:hypothetical protein
MAKKQTTKARPAPEPFDFGFGESTIDNLDRHGLPITGTDSVQQPLTIPYINNIVNKINRNELIGDINNLKKKLNQIELDFLTF